MDSFASLFCDKLEGQETFEDFLSTETEDFVPDSLAAFIDEAKATLRATQMSLRGHLDSPSRSSTICDDDDSTTPKYNNMLEDDDDRLLRDEVMGKFKGAQMFSPKSDVMISPTKMNISGISITSPSKSTPHMDDQSEELFTISAFAQLQGNELLLADEEFASATKHHEEPELVLDTWVRSTQGEKSIETTSMVRMPQEVQTSEVVTSPSSSKQEELESRLDTKREGSVETPFGSGSHQLVQAADPAPQATPPYMSNTRGVDESFLSDIEPSTESTSDPTSTRSEKKQTLLRKLDDTVFPMKIPRTASPRESALVHQAFTPSLSVEMTAESLSKSHKSSPASNGPSHTAQKEDFYDRLSKPKFQIIPSTSNTPAKALSPRTQESWSKTNPSPARTPPNIHVNGHVTPRSSERQASFDERLIDSTKQSNEDASPRFSALAASFADESVPISLAPKGDSEVSTLCPDVNVKGTTQCSLIKHNAFLLRSLEDKISEDRAFLPNARPPILSVVPEKGESIARKVPSSFNTQKRQVKPPNVKLSVSRPSGGSSSLPTTHTNIPVVPVPKTQPLQQRKIVSTPVSNSLTSSSTSIKEVAVISREKPLFNSDDEIAKARSRIRQHQLLEKQKQSQSDDFAERHAVSTKTSVRDKAISADEGRARARERVKQQQLRDGANEAEGKLRRMVISERVKPVAKSSRAMGAYSTSGEKVEGNLKSNPSTRKFVPPSDEVPATSTRESSTSRLSKNHVTIPKGPRLSMSTKYGEKITPSIYEKNSSSGKTPVRVVSETRSLTVPRSPKLSTQAKYGNKPPPTHWKEKPKVPENVISNIMNTTTNLNLTTPEPFNFHESKVTRIAPSKDKEERSLAESMNYFWEKGLREDIPVTSLDREMTLTIPKSPNFTPLPKRAVPKSTSEKEEEMMEYYNTHPFKASQMKISLSSSKGDVGVPKAKKRKLTIAEPFHLKCDQRATLSKASLAATEEYRSKVDLEECKKQFHARPLPDLSYRSNSNPEAVRPKVVTTPEPFRLATDERRLKAQPRQATPDEIEMNKQFRAIPLPRSTFVGPPQRLNADGVPMTIVTKANPISQPPRLATSGRTEIRMASKEASRKNAEMITKQKERMKLRKQHEKHLQEMANAHMFSPTTPTEAKPFQLSSTLRHGISQHRLEIKRQTELEAEKCLRSFHARPLKLTPPPQKIQSQRPLTSAQPFRLKSLILHDNFCEKERRERMSLESERRTLSTPKARPLPNFQNYKPITPKVTKKLVEPFSPELASKNRAQERKEFDERIAQDYREAEARKKAIAEREAAEDEADLQEKRRLPVSEGGLMQLAKPINAGLT